MAERNQKPKRAPRRKAEKPAPLSVPIVGIGVCAASLGSLGTLFRGLATDLGAAYVVAVRQQDGVPIEAIVETLNGVTAMPVMVPGNGAELLPDQIHVGGPDDLISITDGHIRARRAKQPIGRRGTVDTMLISLAERARDRSVAVILTGLGSDGTAGVTATKEFGGLSIAESVDGEAEASAEAGATTPAGIVDLLLPAGEIAGQVALYLRNLATDETVGPAADTAESVAGQLGQIATVLRTVTGNDFHGYKRNTFLRRVQRRMQVIQVGAIDAYVALLRNDREEALHLFQDLLIGVTQFFRDPQEFEVLADKFLPGLFENAVDDQLRIWVTGCATGEEAYSLAILLREYAAGFDAPPHIQIFATDLDARALAIARAGRYSSAIAEQVKPERLSRWFIREGDTYCVSRELREMCIFSPHNLIRDAPFSRIDLLSCRNLLIYLDSGLQARVIPIFHFSLRPGGLLFLGSSENVTRHQKLFAPVDRKNRIFRRIETAIRILPDFPLTPRPGRRAGQDAAAPPVRPGNLSAAIGRRAQLIAERHAPAYVVIDGQHEVLHFSGRTGRYLEPTTGAASLNLLNLVHRDLRLDLRSALHKVAEEGRPIEIPAIPLADNGRASLVNLAIEPIGDKGAVTAMMVLFQDAGALPQASRKAGRAGASEDHVQRLEAELRLNKDRLQATIEELESTNEELKSSNEEYQSINEELQSANEELETSKEELQSVNEELQTVNAELGHRVTELDRANSDLKNLLESTQIATIFLDNELRVRSFTPAATEIFHLVETDVGRPIEHLGSRIAYAELTADVRQVLSRLGTVERAIKSADGERHYIARVLPYRSIDNFIAGAVMTFLDVSTAVRAETALEKSEEQFRRIVETASDYAIFTIDEEMKVTDWLPGAEAVFGWSAAEMIGRPYAATFTPEDREAGEPEREIGTAARDGVAPDIRWHQRKDGSRVFIHGSVTALGGDNGGPRGYLKIGQDVTERKRAEEHERTLLAELQHRVRNTLGVVRSIARRTALNSESVEEMAMHLEGRIDAFARVQAMATRAADGAIDLNDLIQDELLAHAARDGEQLSVKGPDVTLKAKAAELVSLAIHELATNAVKYGALAAKDGRLAISWTHNGGPLELVWQEAGVAPRVTEPQHEGFGLELLRRVIPYELDAETVLDFRPKGLRFSLSMPMKEPPAEG